MPSKAEEHVLSSYQDFMRYEGVTECLHRDLTPEQKSDKTPGSNSTPEGSFGSQPGDFEELKMDVKKN